MEHTIKNVEAMVKSICANKEIINNMLIQAVENEKRINSELTACSDSRIPLGAQQIDMYREYVQNKEAVKTSLDEYRQILDENRYLISAEFCKRERDYSAMHSFLDTVNTLQIKIMEMLCAVLGTADKLVACI